MNSGDMDEMKGRLKETAGGLTGRDDLKREGKIDRAAGNLKVQVDQVADRARRLFGRGNGSRHH